jgi:hypothetical protein
MPTAIVTISLDTESDKDLLRWLARQPNRSAAVREALRSHVGNANGPTLADVLAEVHALSSKLAGMAYISPPEEREEPEIAATNLDGLLDRLDDDWGGDENV